MGNDIEFAQFSELNLHNSKVYAVLSPNDCFIASAVESQLQIWNVKTRKIYLRYECDTLIDFIKWSPDSELICCGMLKEFLQVWKLDMAHYRCKINGYLPFINVHWAPDSRHLLVTSEFYIKITIFSLVTSGPTEIQHPKSIENGIIFSPCEKYLVAAQKKNCDDFLSVYSCDNWEIIKTFRVDTKDFSTISFSPNGLMIAILESPLIEYKVLFYSIDGRLIGKYSPDANFGLISLSWNHLKKVVAVGDCSGKVTVLDSYIFEVLSSYDHPETLESFDVTLYKVIEQSSGKASAGDAFSSFFELDKVVKTRPVSLLPSTLENDKVKSLLKCGVQLLQFCSKGKYIATINGNMLKTVFIYDVENFKLSDVIVRGSNIKEISWHPEKPYLIICCASNVFDIWTPQSCIRYISPFTDDFLISHATWSSTGQYILLNSREHFAVVFLS